MLLPFILAFTVTLGLSLLLTPVVMKLAAYVGAMDKPNERKVHHIPTPRLGGVSIFISFFGGLLALFLTNPSMISTSWIFGREGLMLFAALFLVLCLGIWDDIRSLKPGQKFLVQLLLSVIIYFSGFSVSNVTNVFGSGTASLGFLDFPLTVLWIVGVTNAINLIDGLDGLASGVSLIAAMTILPIALLQGDSGTAILVLLLVAALLGFLRYNFNPAKIFLGDSGSLFLGFMLAVLSVKSSTKSTTGFALLVPILALGLPIMDTLLSMIRRFLRSFLSQKSDPEKMTSRLKSMFQPDSSHIHHRLIGQGLSHRNTVLILYVVSCGLGVGAFAITVSNSLVASLIILVVGAATMIGVHQLKYKEMALLQNGVLLPLYDKPIMNRESFQVFFDLAAIVGSFVIALVLSGTESLNGLSGSHIQLLVGVSAIQLSIFWMLGMYKRTFTVLGMGDVLRTLKGVIAAVAVTGILLSIIAYPAGREQFAIMIIDIFFLGLFVVGVRMSFQVLQFFSHQGHVGGGKKVVIYGADSNGVLMLERMLEANIPTWTPVGFLDDNPALEGKFFNGYPVFGGQWKLQKLIKEQAIDEIVLCSENIKSETMRRMRILAKKNNISIKRLRVLFEDYHDDEKESVVAPVYQLHAHNPFARNVNQYDDRTSKIERDIPSYVAMANE